MGLPRSSSWHTFSKIELLQSGSARLSGSYSTDVFFCSATVGVLQNAPEHLCVSARAHVGSVRQQMRSFLQTSPFQAGSKELSSASVPRDELQRSPRGHEKQSERSLLPWTYLCL